MKRGWVHFIVMKNGVVYEGRYFFTVSGVSFWRGLDFANVNSCPHAIVATEIERAIPVIELKPQTTDYDYQDALATMAVP